MTLDSRNEGNSLYIHIPFCESKCPYCAFASAVKRSGDEGKFLDAIQKESESRLGRIGVSTPRKTLDTLYVGGGTPTVLSPAAWRNLISIIENTFNFAHGAEITAEANPGSLSPEHLKLWRDWRVTRVSLGVQSFDDAELKFLGRVHSSIQAVEAVKICVSFGFDVSVDLMFGLPGQTLRGWSENLRRAASLTVGHISIYQLTIEPGTPLAARNLSLPDGYRPYRYAQWRLPRDGYEQYEVASFSRPGYESRHNLNYWADGGYIGLGPAAWSYIGGARSQNAPTLGEYSRMAGENGNAAIYSETLSPGPAARQAAILALRTRYGIDWISFEQKHGKVLKEEIEKILKVFPDSLVTMDKGRARFTPSGLRVANKIWEELV